MTFLWIISVILLLLLAIIFAPVRFDFSFDGQVFYKLCVYGIAIYKKNQKTSPKKQSVKSDETKKPQEKKSGFFKKLKDERGFSGTVSFCMSLLSMIIKKVAFFVRRLKFKRFCLDIIVSSDDAAKTAIEYGTVCTAVYPVLSLLTSTARFKLKNINVSTDFDATSPICRLSFSVGTSVITALVVAVSTLVEYNKLKRNVNKGERK